MANQTDKRSVKVFLSFGSNLGDKDEYLRLAIKKLDSNWVKIVKISSFYETEAWGDELLHPFVNCVVQARTFLKAQQLLDHILRIEADMGRIRLDLNKYENRVIDIDLLFYGDEQIATSSLTVPHPHLQEREFVLEPLHEIAPYYTHPILNKNIKELYEDYLKMNNVGG